jgi:hypothetical protein
VPGRIERRISLYTSFVQRTELRWWLWRPDLKMFQRALCDDERGLGQGVYLFV